VLGEHEYGWPSIPPQNFARRPLCKLDLADACAEFTASSAACSIAVSISEISMELWAKVGDGVRGKAAYRGGVRRLHFSAEGVIATGEMKKAAQRLFGNQALSLAFRSAPMDRLTHLLHFARVEAG
jgi:hypothetical protein